MLSINTNIDELIEKFQKLQSEIGAIDFSSALLVGVTAAMGKMTFRIFNLGEDADHKSFGRYTGKRTGSSSKAAKRIAGLTIAQGLEIDGGLTAYEKKRLKKGRQVVYKDLEFTGDLRRGIVTGVVSQNEVICWIPNDNLFLISKYQEEQLAELQGNGKIFTLSQDERELMQENIIEALKQIYDRLLNSK